MYKLPLRLSTHTEPHFIKKNLFNLKILYSKYNVLLLYFHVDQGGGGLISFDFRPPLFRAGTMGAICLFHNSLLLSKNGNEL